jgi:hypothetical protein
MTLFFLGGILRQSVFTRQLGHDQMQNDRVKFKNQFSKALLHFVSIKSGLIF